MTGRSLLALLGGADGRSIGRALLLLKLANVLLAGLHTGALASAGPGAICSLGQSTDGGGGTPPTPDLPLPCCFSGHMVVAPALPPMADVAAPPALVFLGRADDTQWSEPARLISLVHAARGPPSLA